MVLLNSASAGHRAFSARGNQAEETTRCESPRSRRREPQVSCAFSVKIIFSGLGRCGILSDMMKLNIALLLAVAGLAGCSTANISRSGTLLSGMTQYQEEMQSLNNVSRWPERQRTAGSLKTVITRTVGASPEFYRLVDLDLRKREFTVTMRETNLRPDRLREMQESWLPWMKRSQRSNRW